MTAFKMQVFDSQAKSGCILDDVIDDEFKPIGINHASFWIPG